MAPKKRNHVVLKIILILIMLGLIAASAYVVKLCLELPGVPVEEKPMESLQLPDTSREDEEEEEDETQPTET